MVPAAGQQVDRDSLRRCTSLPTPEQRLACFEALAADPETAPYDPAAGADPVPAVVLTPGAAMPDTAAASQAAPAVGDGGPSVADPAQAGTTPGGGEIREVLPVPQAAPIVVGSAATDTPMPAAETVVAERGDASVEATGGHEESASGQVGRSGNEVLVATVTRVTRGFNDRLTFYLENGQVWRQQTRGYIHYPKDRPFEVEISKGMMGDHRLRVGGEGRLTRVVLVE